MPWSTSRRSGRALSLRHRKGIAEALTDITVALIPEGRGVPSATTLRPALYRYAFNISARVAQPPPTLSSTMAWLERHSPTLAQLDDATVLRRVLNRLALRQDGSPAAAATVARKRATLHSVLEYAVELELFATNPLKRIRWKPPLPTHFVAAGSWSTRLRRGACSKPSSSPTPHSPRSSPASTTPGSAPPKPATYAPKTSPSSETAGDRSC
jgi:hypothetical protein